jgi:8-oxo-dGTP pyrophosphatase MutT (NUDIX family)
VGDADIVEPVSDVPRIPGSAGALIFDVANRLLILKPTYKKRWTIPGGQIESGGESPWEACRRETREECGLHLVGGRLVCVDFLRPRPNRPGGVRFLFDCGTFTDRQLSEIRLDRHEIADHRFVAPADAAALLSGPVGRRVAAAIGASECLYLEDGRPVPGVGR